MFLGSQRILLMYRLVCIPESCEKVRRIGYFCQFLRKTVWELFNKHWFEDKEMLAKPDKIERVNLGEHILIVFKVQFDILYEQLDLYVNE